MKGRKGQRGKTGQKEETNSKGTQKTLVEEGTHKEINILMGMIDTRGNPNIIMIVDQQEVLLAEINSRLHRPNISDQQSRTLGGGPEVMGYLVGSEAKTGPGQLKIYATC